MNEKDRDNEMKYNNEYDNDNRPMMHMGPGFGMQHHMGPGYYGGFPIGAALLPGLMGGAFLPGYYYGMNQCPYGAKCPYMGMQQGMPMSMPMQMSRCYIDGDGFLVSY